MKILESFTNKKKCNNFLNILAIISFISLALFNTVIYFHHINIDGGAVGNGGDMLFHFKMIKGLLSSQYIFPKYALNSFFNDGSAVFTMYPYIFLYPFSIFYRYSHSVMLTTCFIMFVNTFMCLIISYFSSLLLSKNKAISFIFSMIYSLSFSLFYNTILYSVGMNNSFIFMPLVIFGFIYWLKYSKWVMLSIGMTCLIYSEVIVSAFIPLFLVIWLSMNIKKISFRKIKNLVKSVCLTLLSTVMFWIPAFKIFVFNRLKSMSCSTINYNSNLHVMISQIIHLPTINNNGAFTIYSILGIISGCIFFKYFSYILKQFYILSIIIFFICSEFFPWKLLHDTFVGNLQSPDRLLLIPQVLISYILSFSIYYIIRNKNCIYKLVIFIIIILIIMGYQVHVQRNYLHSPNFTDSIVPKSFINEQSNYIGNSDYLPVNSLPAFKNIVTHQITSKEKHSPNNAKNVKNGNFNIFLNNGVKTLFIPFVYYHGQTYKCYLDGKLVKSYPNKNQLMAINNVPSGHHRIHINIPLTKTDIVARIMTVISLPAYGFIIFKKLKRRKKLN